MSARFSSLKWLAVCVGIGALAFSAVPGHAESVPVAYNNAESTCLSCHENLYYLYDTGNWFCVAEAPMRCVNCHGGDPTALDQAAAHLSRTAHPIINGDTTTCQHCHVGDCAEHVQQFDRVAGISRDIKIAVSTQPQAASPRPIDQSPTPAADPVGVLWSLGGVIIFAAALGGLWLLRHHRAANHGK